MNGYRVTVLLPHGETVSGQVFSLLFYQTRNQGIETVIYALTAEYRLKYDAATTCIEGVLITRLG